MTPSSRINSARSRSDRVPGIYVTGYLLVTVAALALMIHGVCMAIANRSGTLPIHEPTTQVETNQVLINNERLLAMADENMRKSNFKEGVWELSLGVPLLGWAGKMAITCVLFNSPSPVQSESTEETV